MAVGIVIMRAKVSTLTKIEVLGIVLLWISFTQCIRQLPHSKPDVEAHCRKTWTKISELLLRIRSTRSL